MKPNRILAIWGYIWLEIETDITNMFIQSLLMPIFLTCAGKRQMMNGYKVLVLPFDEIQNLPSFTMKVERTFSQLSAYLRTWSLVKRYITT
ncbi:MAG: SAM-dependent methyltransferase, partial [Anaerolineales bacterium]